MERESKFPSSPLTIEHFVFDEISFKRIGFHKDGDELQTSFAVNVQKDSADHYRVTFLVSVTKQEEYEASVQMTGYCQVNPETPGLDVLLNENVPAILLPYIRAQLTLLTSQPETMPAVLPVINVHDLVQQAKDEQKNVQNPDRHTETSQQK